VVNDALRMGRIYIAAFSAHDAAYLSPAKAAETIKEMAARTLFASYDKVEHVLDDDLPPPSGIVENLRFSYAERLLDSPNRESVTLNDMLGCIRDGYPLNSLVDPDIRRLVATSPESNIELHMFSLIHDKERMLDHPREAAKNPDVVQRQHDIWAARDQMGLLPPAPQVATDAIAENVDHVDVTLGHDFPSERNSIDRRVRKVLSLTRGIEAMTVAMTLGRREIGEIHDRTTSEVDEIRDENLHADLSP
jgi:hypothetical protein